MAISSGGVGSGLPVESLITQLMAVERKPLELLTKKEAGYQSKLSAFGTMKGALAALQTAAKALSTPAQVAPMKASVASATTLGVTAGPGSSVGSYNVEVQTLAEAQKLKTSVGFANTSDVVGSGVITFSFGSYEAVPPTDPPTVPPVPPVFTANAAAPAKNVTINPASNSLADIKSAINNAGIGVTASIINDGTSNYLAFTSASGAKMAMQVSVSDPSLGALSYNGDPLASNMAQTVAAQDAVIFVDTVKIVKPSNTITDAIEGVTLNLTNTTAAGVTTKVTVAPQMTEVKTAIEAFVKAYNDAAKSMADLTAYDVATGKGAILNGDSTVRSVQNQLRSLMGNMVTGAPVGSSSLTNIGITTQRDGSLAIDATKLDKALADPTKNFTALFASSGTNRGYGAQMDVLLGRILSPVGTISSNTNGINSSIKELGRQRESIELRLDGVEARYRKQFSALDKAMASMTTTSNFLTQQLASLANNS